MFCFFLFIRHYLLQYISFIIGDTAAAVHFFKEKLLRRINMLQKQSVRLLQKLSELQWFVLQQFGKPRYGFIGYTEYCHL